ncbi:hypothetical protein E2562_033717 [Oryza meyeriana var. granulata]|uniref:No apical meristem-associated C-terminal domain-containing protein n=1 Tax=Oryza meyeriana var. granulata TaxID=110450 RepID=A0A6G1DTZ6_9ORYZ|nr:hypothetical protein E2562_033717 [Oryza meyeriana var. granulata]
MSYPPMNGQPSQGFSIDNNHGSKDPPSLKSQRARKKKKVSRSGTAFTKEEDMVIDDAVEMYEKTEPFTFMHCWKLLRNEAKWNSRFLELNNSTSPDRMSPPSTQGHTVAGHVESRNENVDTARPEGRNSAKRHRSKSFTETSSSSTAVEVLQRLHEKSEKTELKQDHLMVEIFSRKDEKIKIQRDLFNLQKKHMKMSMKQHKKKNEIREKQIEAELISIESSIMSIDIEKVPLLS